MTYPTKVFVATVGGGIYYSSSFTGPGGAMPTWTPVNGGLATLNVRALQLDPEAPSGRQYALSTEGVVYRRVGGDWVELLSVAESRVLANNSVRGTIIDLSVDPITGYMYALFDPGAYTGSNGTATWPYCLRSTNKGESWSATLLDSYQYFYWTRGGGNIQAYNGVVVAARQQYNAKDRLYYSTDNGVTFGATIINLSDGAIFNPFVHLNRGNQLTAYLNDATTELVDLMAVTISTLATARMQDAKDLGPFYKRSMWTDPTDANRMASMAHQADTKLWRTTDAWANLVDAAQGASARAYLHIICPQSVYGEWILGASDSGLTGVRASADGVTTEDKSGTNNNISPYTDAIPSNCGGIRDIQAVIDIVTEGPTPGPGETITPPGGSPIPLGGTAYVQAVTMPDYDGYDMGEPMPGDRGAYLVTTDTWAKLHASDIRRNIVDGEVTRVHLPLAGNAAGDGVIWNGTAWVAEDIATQAELEALALDDLADVDTTGVVAGDALLYDGDSWAVGDVLTPAEHTAIGNSAPHHAAVTLGAGNDAALAMVGQELTLTMPTIANQYRQYTYMDNGDSTWSFVVNGDGMPVFALLNTE